MCAIIPAAWGQSGTRGTVTVTVLDSAGGIVQSAQLKLQDVATNDVRIAETQGQGSYSFVSLLFGTYNLTVSKDGFETQVLDSITVQSGRTTDLTVVLKIGSASQRVEVIADAAPLMETTASALSTTINMKQIEDLPLGGRNLAPLSNLVPGYTGTFNGMRGAATGSNIDGVIDNTSRFKDGGVASPFQSARIEDIQEMTIQTDQLDLNQGFGQANMQVNFVTRRGSNAFHGRLFENFQSSALSANSWGNNANKIPKGKSHLNDFGVSVGGPILKDKLFFFGSYAENKRPGGLFPTNQVLTPSAQQGNFTYTDTTGKLQTVNVLQVAQNAGLGLPTTINSVIASEQQTINKAIPLGTLSALSDPNVNLLTWTQPSTITSYFPTVRLDYNISQNFRINWAWNETKVDSPTGLAPQFPGPDFNYQVDGSKSKAYTASLGLDWTIRPTLVNQLRGGYLYLYQAGAYKAGSTYQKQPLIFWNIPGMPAFGSGAFFYTTQSNFYPLLNVSDNTTWQHRAHTLSFGMSWYREQDHYWNPPLGYNNINLGLVGGDPALNIFTTGATGTVPNATGAQQGEAQALYAALVGRVRRISGNHPTDPNTKQFVPFGAVNLDELQQAYGVFFQDSYRIKPTLTLNFGLRWDFTGDDHDLSAIYHGIAQADLWGPSGFANSFNPGSLKGNPDPQYNATSHQYKPWNVSPQPSFAIAWNPQFHNGLMGMLTGGGKTTIRTGYALRRYTEAYQNFWSYASNYGAFFYQSFNLRANLTGATGTFAPGTVSLSNPLPSNLPPYVFSPTSVTNTFPETGATFNGLSMAGMNPNISQPYIQSWNIGIQRQLGAKNLIEVRYVGNRGIHEWLGLNVNEVNIFENGFLKQFQAAQANLAINKAAGVNSFANTGLPGQQPLPIFDAAFAGEGKTGGFFNDYRNQQFLNWLVQGQAGTFANTLTGIGGAANYFCNLVGPSFTPCVTNANYKGTGAGYPINFFQANPFQSGGGVGYLDSAGYSNYNGLQVEFRQQQWHGMNFDANYTWSHSMSIEGANTGDSQFGMNSLRNLRLNYQPSYFDRRHVLNVLGTYDLPLGYGKAFVNRKGILDKLVGGWTGGTILTFQTGLPFRLTGGYSTFNNLADGGVVLNGVTLSQLQSSVGVHHPLDANGNPLATVTLLDPKYYVFNPANGQPTGANPNFISPNSTAGTIGMIPWLHGPHTLTADMSLTKNVSIREHLSFRLQAEMLNAFNHPIFTTGFNTTTGIQATNFGVGGGSNGGRGIQFRANLEF